MTYYENGKIIIKEMTIDDAKIITDEEIKQGWHQTVDKYLKYIEDAKNNKCVSLIAYYDNNQAGYVNLYFKATNGPKSLKEYPMIVDLGVLVKYRNLGIGTALMNTVEELAKKYSNNVVLAVGLHEGYGKAQRMYTKRNYIFDGSGVWYLDKVCPQYSPCNNDDDLVLYMIKDISKC